MAPLLSRKPTFLWQGASIVLPVLLLAAVGVVSLWKDWTTVNLEARAAAEQAAQQIALFLSAELHAELQERSLPGVPAAGIWPAGNLVDHRGRLLSVGPDRSPGKIDGIPETAPLRPERLDRSAAELWHKARRTEALDSASAVVAYREFLQLVPPEPFRSNARYALALLLVAEGEEGAALALLEAVASAVEATEAGLPLAVLADYQRVKILAAKGRSGADAEARAELERAIRQLCSSARAQPFFASARLLQSTAEAVAADRGLRQTVNACRDLWAADENTRAFFRSLQLRAGGDDSFWSYRDGDNRLVVLRPVEPLPGSTDALFEALVFPEPTLREAAGLLIQLLPLRQPRYLGVTISLNGHSLIKQNPAAEVLARYDDFWRVGESALPGLEVAVHLTDPDLLYAQQRQRALWFGGLILLATAAAVIGYLATRRAYYRQLHLNELKSNFVASVSHELRAPLASIRLMAEGLDRGAVQQAEKQQSYFKFIVQECRRLSALIENVLDFSRIEQERKQYVFEPADIVAIVGHTADLMGPCASERRVRIETKIDPAFAALSLQPRLDGKAIQQALVNLIDNAIKHSPPGANVMVELERSSGTGSLLLAVEDAGEGIPAAEQERIFERFYRLGSELRRETQGAGIGLSIVKHIVEAHGGTNRVRSEPGRGSRFAMEIPCELPESAPASPAASCQP